MNSRIRQCEAAFAVAALADPPDFQVIATGSDPGAVLEQNPEFEIHAPPAARGQHQPKTNCAYLEVAGRRP